MTLSGELSELFKHHKHFRAPSRLLDLTMQADRGGVCETPIMLIKNTVFPKSEHA
jgi:hypothetical protein